MHRTIIIGAGHGGSQCAVSLRQAGYDGEIVLVDHEDMPYPYHKPPLSKQYLADEDGRLKPLRAKSAYEKADVRIERRSVSGLDTAASTLHVEAGESLGYDVLVLATGANNRSLPVFNGVKNVHGLRTASDAERLRSSLLDANEVVVLGGGFIGLELAASMASTGKAVHVLEAADRVLARVAAEPVSAMVEKALGALGIELSLNTMASDFEIQDNRLQAIQLDQSTAIECDCLVVGIGAIPAVTLAEQAGMDCNNGIVVNDALESSVENIYAIGDCANFPHWQTSEHVRLESVQNAVDQAKCVALTIATGSRNVYRTVPWFWSDIGALKLQIAGIHNGNTQTVLRQEADQLALYHLDQGRIVCVESINSAKDHLFARKAIEQGLLVDADAVMQGADHLKSLLA